VETKTKLPVFDIYCFDKNGRGTLSTDVLDESGKTIDTCRTTATVTRKKDQVIIEDNGAKCPREGTTFVRYVMTCKKESNNRTRCTIKEKNFTKDSLKPFNNKFTFLGKK
jgi:hypothetical protein